MVTSEIESVSKMKYWFVTAAICHGYATDSMRAQFADEVVGDVEKIASDIMTLPDGGREIAKQLMRTDNLPWVRFHAAVVFAQLDSVESLTTLRSLATMDGMFAPLASALANDMEAARH